MTEELTEESAKWTTQSTRLTSQPYSRSQSRRQFLSKKMASSAAKNEGKKLHGFRVQFNAEFTSQVINFPIESEEIIM